MTRGVRSLLVVRLSAIGDVVHTLPALELLRASLPGWKIGWAVEAEAAPLLAGHPAIDALHVLDRRALRRGRGRVEALRELGRLLVRPRRERYEVALDFQGLARSALAARLHGRRVLGSRHARELAAWTYEQRLDAPAPWEAHACERYLALARRTLEVLSVEPGEPLPPRLGLPPCPVALPSDFLAVLPGAGKPANRPPVSLLAAVVRGVSSDLPTVVVGGPRDRRAGERLAAAGALDLCGKLGLAESASVLARASAVLGGDTGPLHVARALGRPTVALFFAADPARTGPAGFPGRAPALVVRGGASCAPCLARTCRRPDGVRVCLEPISAERVLAAVRAALPRVPVLA